MRQRLGHDRISQGSRRILQFFVARWQVVLARRQRSGHHPVTRRVHTDKRCSDKYATQAALTQTRLGTEQRMRNKHMKRSMTADFHLTPNRRILGRVEGVAAWSSPRGHDRLDRSEQHESISQLPNTNSTTDAPLLELPVSHITSPGSPIPSPSNLKADATLNRHERCVHRAQPMDGRRSSCFYVPSEHVLYVMKYLVTMLRTHPRNRIDCSTRESRPDRRRRLHSLPPPSARTR
jgi:hypothetical protein